MHDHGAEQEHACDTNADGRLLYNYVRTKVTARMDGGWRWIGDVAGAGAGAGPRLEFFGCICMDACTILSTALARRPPGPPCKYVSSPDVTGACMHVHGSFRFGGGTNSIGAGYILNSLSYHMHARALRTFPSIGLERECQCKTCNNDRERTPRP